MQHPIIQNGILFLKELKRRYIEHQIAQTGGAVAFFLLLSVFPFLIFLNAFVGFFEYNILSLLPYLSLVLPPDILALLQDYLSLITGENNTVLFSVGILGTLFSSTKFMDSIYFSLTKAYGIVETRNIVFRRLISLLLLVLFGVMMIIALISITIGPGMLHTILAFLSLPEELTQVIDLAWLDLRWMLVISIMIITFFSINYFLPNISLSFRSVLPGTLFVTVAWFFTSYLFSIYVNNFKNFQAIYGYFGSIIILLLWLQLSGVLLALGGEINSILLHWPPKIGTTERSTEN